MNPEYAAVVVAAGLLILLVVAWKRYLDRKAAADRLLPQGAAPLAAGGLVWNRVRSRGRLTLVLVGTYGVNQGWRIIDTFVRAGCVDDVGAIVVLELDERQRTKFLVDLAAVAPRLVARTTSCRSTLLPGGLQNAAVEQVGAPEVRQYWQPAIADTIEEACRFIRGTEYRVLGPASWAGSAGATQQTQQQGYDPAVVLVVASPGGHTELGVFAGQELQRNFPLARIYVITVLAADGQMRREFPKGLARYEQKGFARWYLVSDNRRHAVENDYAVAAFPAGIWVAALLADTQDEPWNVLVRLFPRGRGGVIVPRLWARMLPALRTRSKPPVFFTFEDAIIRAVLEGIDAIEAEDTKAIALPTPAPDTSRYVLVTVPLVPDDLVAVKDKVEEALRARGWFAADGNRHLVWATVAEHLTADTTSVRMSVVMVEAAVDGLAELAALAEGEALAAPRVPAALPPAADVGSGGTNGRNGVAPAGSDPLAQPVVAGPE